MPCKTKTRKKNNASVTPRYNIIYAFHAMASSNKKMKHTKRNSRCNRRGACGIWNRACSIETCVLSFVFFVCVLLCQTGDTFLVLHKPKWEADCIPHLDFPWSKMRFIPCCWCCAVPIAKKMRREVWLRLIRRVRRGGSVWRWISSAICAAGAVRGGGQCFSCQVMLMVGSWEEKGGGEERWETWRHAFNAPSCGFVDARVFGFCNLSSHFFTTHTLTRFRTNHHSPFRLHTTALYVRSSNDDDSCAESEKAAQARIVSCFCEGIVCLICLIFPFVRTYRYIIALKWICTYVRM